MPFPISAVSYIDSAAGHIERAITLRSGLTVVLGPNGSGKSHLLRGLKTGLRGFTADKPVVLLPTGRLSNIEAFRANVTGYNPVPQWERATYGDSDAAERRHSLESLESGFHTLAKRPDVRVKVQERLKSLFGRELIIEYAQGNLKPQFRRTEEGQSPYWFSREASGLMHIAGLLASLYDDHIGALIIDEPEVSLHPQMQAFLLKEMLSVAGDPSADPTKKLVVIATHSTELVPINKVDDLASLVFCYDLQSDPVQLAPDIPELRNVRLRSLVARLGQEHKLSLFANKPLLVEGPSDAMIVTALTNRNDLHIEAAGSQILPVVGKENMQPVFRLFRLMGKQPLSLCDADAFVDGVGVTNAFLSDSALANQQAVEDGHQSAIQVATKVRSDFLQLVDSRWAEIEEVASLHPYFVDDARTPEELRRRRAAFCVLFDGSFNVAGHPDWAAMAKRLAKVLDLLEISGCFILRKGTIESYYGLSQQERAEYDKVTLAVQQMTQIEEQDRRDTKVQYDVVYRCVKEASERKQIDEAAALAVLILRYLAPAQHMLKSGESHDAIRGQLRQSLGEGSALFDVQISEDRIQVDLASKVLKVSGFPVSIGPDDNAVSVVHAALKRTG